MVRRHTACRIKKSVRKTERGTSVTVVKFKIRCSRYLYTLVVNDAEKADKLRGSLPPSASLLCPAAEETLVTQAELRRAALKIEDVDKPTGKKKK